MSQYYSAFDIGEARRLCIFSFVLPFPSYYRTSESKITSRRAVSLFVPLVPVDFTKYGEAGL